MMTQAVVILQCT